MTAAAVLEDVGGLVIVKSRVELRTSAWLARLRVWGRNMISVNREVGNKQFTHRKIVLGARSVEPIESFDNLESLLRSYVGIANEQSLPLGKS